MFALKFDGAQRLMKTKGVELHKIATAAKDTDEWNTWMGVYLMPENTALDIYVEDDNSTYTFFTTHFHPAKVEEEAKDFELPE